MTQAAEEDILCRGYYGVIGLVSTTGPHRSLAGGSHHCNIRYLSTFSVIVIPAEMIGRLTLQPSMKKFKILIMCCRHPINTPDKICGRMVRLVT